MKKFLRVDNNCYVRISKISMVQEFNKGENPKIIVCIPDEINKDYDDFDITDSRTLSDIIAEIEGEVEKSEKVCKWRKTKHKSTLEGCYVFDPHGVNDYIWSGHLEEKPYCPVCGGRIEVVE